MNNNGFLNIKSLFISTKDLFKTLLNNDLRIKTILNQFYIGNKSFSRFNSAINKFKFGYFSK